MLLLPSAAAVALLLYLPSAATLLLPAPAARMEERVWATSPVLSAPDPPTMPLSDVPFRWLCPEALPRGVPKLPVAKDSAVDDAACSNRPAS